MICTIIDIRGDYAYVKYQDSGVVTPDINDSADHRSLLLTDEIGKRLGLRLRQTVGCLFSGDGIH